MDAPDWRSVVEAIKASGWRQGSIIPSDLAVHVLSFHASGAVAQKEALEAGALLAVASHTCDVQNMGVGKEGRPAEPLVEAILGVPIKGTPGEQKTVRFIDLPVRVGNTQQTYRFQDQTRFRFPRELLAGKDPMADPIMADDDARRLGRFLAKRFDRPAFPDAFEEALRPAQETLRRPLKAQPDLMTGVFFELSPDGEVTDGGKYQLTITGTMRSRRFSSKAEVDSKRFKYYEDDGHRGAAEELLRTLAETITARCTQIDLADPVTGELRYEVVSEGVLSLGDYRRMVRYDWDYLSPDADDLPAQTPEG